MNKKTLLLNLFLTLGISTSAIADQNLNVQNISASAAVSNTVSQPINYVEIDPQAYASNLKHIR